VARTQWDPVVAEEQVAVSGRQDSSFRENLLQKFVGVLVGIDGDQRHLITTKVFYDFLL
jgi:hypothetical protein